jgi:hypothetical protein
VHGRFLGNLTNSEADCPSSSSRALTAKAGERPATMAATSNQLAYEKSNASANSQIKVLTDLVKSLLKAMEEQKEEHAHQLETLTKTFTQQIETLKAQVMEMTEKIETQLSNIQPPPSASPSYAEVARTPPSSRPSNVHTNPHLDGYDTINDDRHIVLHD